MADTDENTSFQRLKKNSRTIEKHELLVGETTIHSKCLNCGWAMSTTADVCENCGDWLLKGKCNFCYAEVEEGQKFCAECGNPPNGIICKACRKLSHFDFCQHCNVPLTEQANESIALIANAIEFQNLVNATEYQLIQEKLDAELNKPIGYRSKLNAQNSKKKDVFVLKRNPNLNIEENIKLVEQSKQNINEKGQIIQQQQKETRALKVLEDLKKKSFSNNQEARKFFGALKIYLPQIIYRRIPIGWKCNAYDCIHENGPQECGDPSLGGIWLYEEKKETTFKETEI